MDNEVQKKTDAKLGFMGGFLAGLKKMDGWVNIISGIGTQNRDANTASKIRWTPLTETQIEDLYAAEAIAEKIVDMPIEDALTSGYKITGISKEQENALKPKLKQLKVDSITMDAAKKARLYGGSIIVKIYNDNFKLQEPVTGLLASGKKEIKNLKVLQRFEAYAQYEDINKDIFSANFGKPNYYSVYSRVESQLIGVKIHASRTIRFDGKQLPDALHRQNNYWGDSVLTKLEEPIRNYAMSYASVANALSDLSVAVFKIKNLADQVATDCDDKVLQRMQIVNLSKSIARAVIVDADGEDFDYKNRSMTGVAELLDAASGRLTAASGMPHTVLLGNSPTGGLGQSGNHEERNWNKWVSNYVESHIKEGHLALIKEIAEGMGIDSSAMDIEYFSPTEPTEQEEVATRKSQAEVDQIYISNGVLDAEEVRKSRFGGDKYSIDTQIDANIEASDLTKEELENPNV